MKKTIIILSALVLLSGCIKAQTKKQLKEMGSGFYRDTTFITMQLTGKDSVSYERETESCKCAVFRTKSGLMPCDSLLKQHYIIQHWAWQYTQYFFNDEVIRTEKPVWRSTWGTGSTTDYDYFYNGKFVYPLEFYSQPIQH